MQKVRGRCRPYVAIGMFISSLMFYSCGTQEEYGTDLIPSEWNDALQMTDTLSVGAYCTEDDTLKMNGVDFGVIGQFNDPVFGQTNALFYSNLSVASPVQSYGPEPIIDSVVLFLKFADYYGRNTKLSHRPRDIRFTTHSSQFILRHWVRLKQLRCFLLQEPKGLYLRFDWTPPWELDFCRQIV